MRRRTFLSLLPALAIAPLVLRAQSTGEPNAVHALRAMEPLLERIPASMQPWLNAEAHRVEIILERRDTHGTWHTARHGRRWSRTWSPAASVAKLPMALLMAERLQAAGVDASAVLMLDAKPATGEWDEGDALGSTFRRDLARTFAVSDNVPYNRWYEVLGADAIHARLASLGYPHVRLVSRLGSTDIEANRRSGGGRVIAADGSPVAVMPPRIARARRFPFGAAPLGRAWQHDDGRIEQRPRDMRFANFLPLADSLRMLRAFVRPESVAPHQRWRIDGALRAQLLHALALVPRDSTDPAFDPAQVSEGHARFLFHGDDGQRPRPAGVGVFGKSGQAYGFLSEVAHVVEPATGVELMLAARVQANADGIVNDDRYEYDSVARPLLAAIGDAALAMERERLRHARPPG